MTALNRLSQDAFRGRLDDGVESLQQSDGGATWIAAINTSWTQDVGKIIRPRFLCVRTAGSSLNTSLHLYYSHNAGAYTLINRTSSVVRTAETSWYTDQSDATAFTGRLGSGTWADVTNGCRASTEFAGVVNFGTALVEMEPEWSLFIVKADVAHNDTIDLRVHVPTGIVFSNGYAQTPRMTVNKPVVEEPGFKAVAVINRAYSFARRR